MSDPWAEYRVPSSRAGAATRPRSAAEELYDEMAQDAVKRRENERARAAAVGVSDNPDTKAKARQVAREAGVAPPVAEANLAGYERELRMRQAGDAARDARLGVWLGRNAEIASDEIPFALTLRDKSDAFKGINYGTAGPLAQVVRAAEELQTPFGQARLRRAERRGEIMTDEEMLAQNEQYEIRKRQARGVWGQVAGSLRAGTALASAGIWGTAAAAAGAVGADDVEAFLMEGSKASSDYAARERGRSTSFVVDSAYAGLESIPTSAAAVATGSLTVSGLLFMATTGGQEYVSARDQGLGVGSSLLYGGSQGGIEVLTERLPVGSLIDLAKGKTGVGRAVKRFLWQEMATEQVATVAQDFNEWATLNPDKPFSQYLAERPEAAARTAIGTLTGAGPQAAVSYGLRKSLELQSRLENDEARMIALDEVMTTAGEMKTRQRDAGAFRELVRSLVGDGEKVYVPAEKVAELFQDYTNDEFWGDYAGDIREGLVTGGDVALPVDDVVTRLAGSDTWEAIKGDVRPSPGGASLSEVEAANAEIDDLQFEAQEAVDREERAAKQAAAPGDKIRQAIRDRLMNAGMRPEEAATNAEVTAALFETEAANLGRSLTGREFDAVSVQRVLPELLKAPEAADTIDLIINAMRQGGDPSVGVGQTLMQFIRDRGGINDPGGDLASMGFPKRLIREFNPDQGALGGFSGAGDYGVDSTLRAAIEAGFFPELQGVEAESGPSQLDTQSLLDAIGQELSGSPVYAEVREDMMRAAAVELRDLLGSAGLDPDGLSDAEIRGFVEGMDGRELSQGLPEKIDIDGVERWTVNSEGMPIGQAVEAVRAFWAWFGDSKVVDAQGRPLVVYHGTLENIEAFDRARLGENTQAESARAGFFFTSDPEVAASYAHYAATVRPVEKLIEEANAAERRGDWDAYDAKIVEAERLEDSFNEFDNRLRGQQVLPAYLAASAPVELDAAGESFFGIEGDIHSAIKEARRSGDGAIFRNLDDAAGLADRDADHFLVFNPEQIKSINNRGTFDPADARILYQRGKGPNASIQFRDAQAIIRLFETANASSFQHEMAHFWLERFAANAQTTIDMDGNPAARQTFADFETLKAWFKSEGFEVGSDNVIPEGAHELFARGWERYLMEGKAPSISLQSAFRKFARWLKAIYRTVLKLNAPITPEVREVMDRMLATQEQIDEARADQEATLMFEDAVEAGMTDAEARRYAELGEQARNEAEEELYGKVFRSIRARELKAYRAQEKAVRAEVTASIDNQPMFRALAMLRSKGGARLDKTWLRDNYGEDVFSVLPSGMPVWRDGGDSADQIAEMAGFKSGDELVRTLMGMEATRKQMREGGDKRSVRARTIDEAVAREMNDRYEDPLSDGSIEREAQAAVLNERNGERVEMELRALGSKSRKKPTPYKLAREWAQRRIERGVVADTISGAAQYRYARTAAKASRDALKAYADGDNEAAFRFKQIELLNVALAREAADASERVEKAVKRMGDLAKQRMVKTMAQDYLERIHGLLEDYEFKRVSQRQIAARDAYAAWAQAQTDAGHDVVAVERLAQKKNWSRMTVDEITALDDAVKQLRHLGRLKQTLLDNKERRDFEAVRGEAIGQMAMLRQKPKKGWFGGETRLDWLKSGVASMNAVLIKMEEVFDHLDSDDADGVFNRIVFRPIAEAQDRERQMLDDTMGRLLEAMKGLPRERHKRWQQRILIPELPDPDTGGPSTFLGTELVAMALNMGNRGNMEKLIGGYEWDKSLGGMEQARGVVMEVLNRELSPDEWQYVQTVWDTVNELWPEIEALERRVNGIAPDKIEATTIDTNAGTLSGGYFPAVYDPRSRVGERNLEVESQGLFPAQYFRSTTVAGSTKERTEFKGPLYLDLGVINRHVAEVIHDITHREAVMNADKFLSDDRIKAAAENVLGPEVVKQWRPWLQHIANEWASDREGNSKAERMLKATRTNATMVGLGLRVSTMMMQLSGYSNSIERIGFMPVMRGIKKMLTPGGFDFAMGHSKELPSRMSTMDRDIRDNARRLASKQAGVLDSVQRFAFHGIGYMDRLVSVGTWLGAYDKALSEGLEHDAAVYSADKAVRQSQGSGAAKDLARVQRGSGKGGEAWKLLTMFYSYSSAFYQRQYRLVRDTRTAIAERDLAFAPEFAARALWLVIVPAILSEFLAGRGPDEEDDPAEWAMWKMLSSWAQGVPLSRDLFRAWESGFEPEYTPAGGLVKSIYKVGEDVGKVAEGEETKRATRNFLEMTGYVTGKIPGQVSATTQFLVDVGYGEQDPETAAEWWEGLTKGKIAA